MRSHRPVGRYWRLKYRFAGKEKRISLGVSVTKEQDAATRASFGFWEIFHTAVVLAIIAAIYIYFW